MMLVKSALAVSMLAVVAIFHPAMAAAQQPVPELVVGFEPESSVGKEIAVGAYLIDPAGNPIRGETVTFYMDAEFLNTLGRAEIGRSLTDENGLAMFIYEPKSTGERTITAKFAGNQVFAPTESSEPLKVEPGPPTFIQERPLRIPGANIGIVVTVLITVWSLYLFVMGLLWFLSRSGPAERPRLWRTSNE